MTVEFTQEELNKVATIRAKYPEPKAALMAILWMSQNKWGWISEEVIIYVADLLKLEYSHVEGVASFYTMYFKKKMGKHHLQVCTNVSCMLRGGDKIFAHVSEKYGIHHNEVTSDCRFSLEEVECMGACGGAPMMAVNEDFFENLTIEEVDKILDNLS